MKIQNIRVKQIVGYLITTLFLISCGQGSSLDVLPQSKSTPKKTSTNTNTGTVLGSDLQNSTNTTGSTQSSTQTQSSTTKPLDSESCLATRTLMVNLNSCSVILQENANYDSNVSKCYAALPYLKKTACSEINSSITSFVNACSGVIASSTIMNAIRTDNVTCYNAIQALK